MTVQYMSRDEKALVHEGSRLDVKVHALEDTINILHALTFTDPNTYFIYNLNKADISTPFFG